MANLMIAPEERNLTPEQVARVDYRRHMGLVFQVISGQTAIIATLLTWWIGQDLVYARPYGHTVTYLFCITATLALTFGIVGTRMRNGSYPID
jgi:hypothetical protein